MFQRSFQIEAEMTARVSQVIENIGGGYRNRTGLHGFAILLLSLKAKASPVNVPALFTVIDQGLMASR